MIYGTRGEHSNYYITDVVHEPMIYGTGGEHSNYYTTDVVHEPMIYGTGGEHSNYYTTDMVQLFRNKSIDPVYMDTWLHTCYIQIHPSIFDLANKR